MSESESMRLDKWLWAARFFKTRQLAVAAITGGKVHLNGQRTKPGKEVCAGSRLRIHKDSLEWTITVDQIPRQRRPASEAVGCYREDEASIRKREEMTATGSPAARRGSATGNRQAQQAGQANDPPLHRK